MPIMRKLRSLAFAVAVAMPMAAEADGLNPAASSQAFTPNQEVAIEGIVARYLEQHPEAVTKAFEAMARKDNVLLDPADGMLGNKAGDVTMIVFLDRASPHSLAAIPVLAALAGTDPGLRIVLKELPLISAVSVDAAKAATAARRQGDDAARRFEAAALAHPGPMTAADVSAIAKAAGLDADRLVADAKDPAISDYLKRTRDLADKLGVRGTPTFLVGDQALVGIQSADVLRAAVTDARSAAR